ncbi:MAG TPA: MMPL family transporter [Polyangiaceae bacterium]
MSAGLRVLLAGPDSAAAHVIKFLLTTGLRWPRATVAVVGLLLVLAAYRVVYGPLTVSTSRTGLVSLESPHQARLVRYLETFGRSQLAVLVVSGETSTARRGMVDRFESELGKFPEFRGRVLGKVTLDGVAETLLVWRPELARFLPLAGSALKPGEDPWIGFFRAAEQRLTAELGADSGAPEGSVPGGAPPARSEKDLTRVADLLQAVRQALASDGRLGVGQLGFSQGGSQVDDQGYLVGAGGRYHLVLVYPALQSDEGREMRPVIERIRAARDRALAAGAARGVQADLTGAPALAVDELESLRQGSQTTSVVSTAGIFVLLMSVFRSLRHVAVALVPMLVSMLLTLGFVQVVYGGLNLVTSSFMSVLMGLGIDFSVHLLYRYGEARERGEELSRALASALHEGGPAVALGATTAIIAFLTTTTTQFAAFSQLGVITATGLVTVAACAFLLFPPLMPTLGGKRAVHMREFYGLSVVMKLVGRAPRWVLGTSLFATLAAVTSLVIRPPSFNGRTFDFLPARAESYRGLQLIEQAGTPPLDAHFTVSSFAEAEAVARRARALPEVSVVQSPSDLLPPETPELVARIKSAVAALPPVLPTLPAASPKDGPARLEALRDLADAFDEVAFALRQAGRDDAGAVRISKELGELGRFLAGQPEQGTRALNRLSRAFESALGRAVGTARNIAERGHFAPRDLPPLFQARFVSKDGTKLAVHVYPSGDVGQASFAERFEAGLRPLDPEVSGTALNMLPHERFITEGFQRAAAYAFVLIAIVIGFVFRRFSDTLLALFPVVVAWLWMLALMRPLGIDFTPANMVALPLLLGVGVDTGVHMIHRTREASGRANLQSLLHGTGTAVSVGTLTNIAGFAALMAAEYRAMQGLGMLLSIGIALSLVTSVVVLPALLVVTGRAAAQD